MTFCPPTPGSSFVAVPCPPPGAVAAHLAVGLCLADDTPIAVILEEETAPGAPPTALGWTNLVTGVFTAGSPPAGSHPCGVDKLTELGAVLCDFQPDGSIAGTALLEITYDDDGAVVSTRLIDPVTGAVYTPTGVLRPCEEPCLKCDTAVLCDNTSTPASEVVASTIKMLDTPNVVGNDGWNVTAFNTANAVNTPQVCPGVAGPPLPVPYPAFYNADWCTAWLAACPGGTAAGGGCALNPGPALGLTSGFESINCGTGSGFSDSCSRYLVEKTFNTDAACTRIRVTSQRFRADGSAKVLIDGQDTGIFGAYNMTSPDGTIILTVAPGVHTMTIDLRDSEAPTWIQGGLTIECLAITPAATTSVQFLRTTCRACSGAIISVTDTTLDGTTPYVPGPTVTICDPAAGNIPQPCANCESFVLADRITNLTGQAGCISFLRRVCHNCDGTVSSVTDTLLDGTSPYSPTGNIGLGCDFPEDEEVLCDAGNLYKPFLRTYVKDTGSVVVGTKDSDLDGVPYTVVGPVVTCIGSTETQLVCDGTSATSLVAVYHFDAGGILLSTLYYGIDGSGPFAPAGPLYEGGCCQPVDLGESCYDSGGGIIRKVVGERRCRTDNPVLFDIFWYDTETGVQVFTPTLVPCSEACGQASIGTVCYTPPPVQNPGVTLSDDWAGSTLVGANDGPQTFTNPNFAGAGITVKATGNVGGGFNGPYVHLGSSSPAAETDHWTVDLQAPRLNVSIDFFNLGTTGGESLSNISPPATSISGAGTLTGGGTGVTPTASDGNFTLTWAGPVQTIQYDWNDTGSGGSTMRTVTFTTIVPSTQTTGIAAVIRDCETGAVTYVDLTTGLVIPNTSTIIDCSAATSSFDFEEEILCDDNGQFIRRFTYTNGVLDPTPIDFNLAGAAYVPVGTIHACCTDTVIGTVCYTPPVTGPALVGVSDDWAGSTLSGSVWTNSNFAGLGRVVTDTLTPVGGSTVLTANGIRNQAVGPATQHHKIDLGAPRLNVKITMDFFGINQGERLRNITPAFTSVTGNGTAVLANTGVDGGPAADGTIIITFPGPVQFIDWDYAPTGTGGLSAQGNITYDDVPVNNTQTKGEAAVIRNCKTGGITYVDLVTGLAVNASTATFVDCASNDDVELEILCDNVGSFIRKYTYNASGTLVSAADFALDGTTPYVVTGTVKICPVTTTSVPPSQLETVQQVFCDNVGPFIRQYFYVNSIETGTNDISLTGAGYIPVGTVKVCNDVDLDFEEQLLCDSTPTRFIRTYVYNAATPGVVSSFFDTTLAGVAFAPVGAVGQCPQTLTVTSEFEVEVVTLCDDNGAFLRRFVYDEATGLPTTVVSTDLAGAVYVPVGTVKVCDQNITVNEFNTELEFLCDNGTTTFLRRYLFNEATGAIGATADFTLAGAAYVPAGPVTAGVCAAAAGTPPTLNSQMVAAVPGTPWTPALVTGVLTSVTMTVISGTATVTDSDATVTSGIPTGYSATWQVLDPNTLTGPQSIASVGGTVLVVWTQR